jgi:hypothetical protein
MLRVNVVVCSLFVLLTSCKRSGTITSSTPAPQPSVPTRHLQKIEPCSLITKEEVGAVQATTVTDAKGSEGSDGSHLITQCYYSTTGPNLSVSIAITQFDPNNVAGPSPREAWEQIFGPFRKEETDMIAVA